jgi:DNA polymerase I-like protein with 3'-5' exonuclease and polymerase domains
MPANTIVLKAQGCRTCPRGASGYRCIASNAAPPGPASEKSILWVYTQPEPVDIAAPEPGTTGSTYSVMRTALAQLYREKPERRRSHIRITYAAQCVPEAEDEKPSAATLQHCQPLLQSVVYQTGPSLIVAFGSHALKQLGIKEKWSDMRGRILEPDITGLKAPLLVTFSERAVAAAAGLFETFLQDLRNGYHRVEMGRSEATTLEELTANYVLPVTMDEALAVMDTILATPLDRYISVDTETTSLRPEKAGTRIIAFPISWDVGVATTIIFDHPHAPPEYLARLPELRAKIAELLASKRPKGFHNYKFDRKWIVLHDQFVLNNVVWCTLGGEHLLDEDKKGNYGLKALTTVFLPKYCGYEDKLFDILEATDEDLIATVDAKIDTLSAEYEDYAEALESFKTEYVTYTAAKAVWDITNATYLSDVAEYEAAVSAYKDALAQWEALPKRPKKPVKPVAPKKATGTDAEFAAHTGALQAYDAAMAVWEAWESPAKPVKDFVRPPRPARLDKLPKEPKDPRTKKERDYSTDGGFEKIPIPMLQLYGGVDADVTRRITSIQLQRLKAEGSTCAKLMGGHVLPASRVLGDMEFHGVTIDQDYIPVLEKGLTDAITKARDELELMAPGVNHNSGPALAKLLYEDGWQPLDNGPRVDAVKCLVLTKKGARSTASAALAPYIKYDEQYVPGQEKPKKIPVRESLFLDRLFLYKKALKARDTFLRNLKILSKRDGKIHCQYHIPGTGTGRLSSSDMNLQNIPKMLAGYNLKKLFITDNQAKLLFVNADYKGAEVRVFTAYSPDPALIKALNDGLDMHSFFAATVFNRPYADYDKRDEPLSHMTEEYCKLLNKERTQIKRVVFGILYGAGPKTIAEQINVTPERGQELIDMLFGMFPSIRDYIDEVKYLVARDGYVDTIFGRRRRFPLMATSRHRGRAERQACNFKVQSTSSDIVIAQLIEMHDVINSNQTWPEWGIHKPLHTYGTRVFLTVHDSIGFQWPKELLHALEAWVTYYGETRVREKFPWLPVPFKIDIEVGPSYGECVALPKYLKNNPANNLEVHDDDEIEILNTLRQDAFEGAA